MRLIFAVLMAFAGLATTAHSQDRMTPEQFMDMAHKRTLTFVHFDSDRLVGIEEFIARDKSVWARDDGRCTYGEITYEGLYICFVYDDDPGGKHCWIPFEYKGDIIVQSTNKQIQRVSNVTNEPVICEDAPLS